MSCDEYYTPPEVLDMILPWLDPSWTIYEPCVGQGHMADYFERKGWRVVRGNDILHYRPPPFDVIITNPPFSMLDQVTEKLYSFGKPFLCIMPLPSLGALRRHRCFKEKGLSLLMPKGRMNFLREGTLQKQPSFYSVWAAFDIPGVPNNCILWL